MKKILIILLLFCACKTISYDNAKHSNEDKFYGDEEKTALLLVDMKDIAQVTNDMSSLAENKAYAKDLCDFAGMVMRDQIRIKTSLEILAFRKRIKLPSYVSAERQKVYHQIESIRDKKSFDKFYLENSRQYFLTMVDISEAYLDKNQEGPVREFIIKHNGIYKDYIKKIDQLKNYMENHEPQVSGVN